MRMRYQAVDQRWRDDSTKERHSVVFKYKYFRREYAIYKLMLCIMGIQSSTDIIL